MKSNRQKITVAVIPKMAVGIVPVNNFNYNTNYDPEKYNRILKQAINTVRKMNADDIKKAVIEGLEDADRYPRDFAEF